MEREFCLALGRQFNRPDVRNMLAQMSASDYLDWSRHFSKHGFSVDLELFAMGQICSTLWLIHSHGKASFPPAHFYPNQPEHDEDTTLSRDELLAEKLASCANHSFTAE